MKETEKKDKYLLYFGILSFLVCIFGAIAFILLYTLPSPVHPIYVFPSLIGTITVSFPWLNWLSIGGLVLLTAGTFARFLGVGKKDHVPRLLLVAIIICILLTVFTLQVVANPVGDNNPNPTLPPDQWYYPTPAPTFYNPYPTTDPNAFSITQRNTVEYIPYSDYTPPTSYGDSSTIQPMYYGGGGYTHAIGIWGTYKNWQFDVYVQVGGAGMFWEYSTSGVTDENGEGYANAPIYASNAGEIHNIVAVINPNGGNPISYGGFTAGELTSLVNAGTLRESNHLSFDVFSGAVL